MISVEESLFKDSPSIITSPPVGLSRPPTKLRKVVFPDPEGPTTDVNSPFLNVDDISSTASDFSINDFLREITSLSKNKDFSISEIELFFLKNSLQAILGPGNLMY